jgi:hypothetical protein
VKIQPQWVVTPGKQRNKPSFEINMRTHHPVITVRIQMKKNNVVAPWDCVNVHTTISENQPFGSDVEIGEADRH